MSSLIASKKYGTVSADEQKEMSGLEFVQGLANGTLPQSPTPSEYMRGALYGLTAVSIGAGFIVVARLGIRTSLTPWDIAAIRFAVSGSLLLPYVIHKGLALDRLGWTGAVSREPLKIWIPPTAEIPIGHR